MTFNKSRVYTALNADEVKVGSKGVFADNVDWLKHFVKDERHISTVEKIESENMVYRFRNINGDNYVTSFNWISIFINIFMIFLWSPQFI